MKVVLDTNVFISGVFFAGSPFQILKAWRDGKVQLIVSLDILEEYYRVGNAFAEEFPDIDLDPIMDLVMANAELVNPPPLSVRICDDADDDKSLACALEGKDRLVVSGEKHLLNVSGYRGIKVVKPRAFVTKYLSRFSDR